MAQRRMRDYKEPLNSEPHNRMQIGPFKPGRYCGYDTILNVSGLTFDIGHGGSGLPFTPESLTPTNQRGVCVGPNGCWIEEDASLTGFSTTTNVGNLTVRVDTLVMEHEFVSVTGGQAAIYFILQGLNGNITPTALPNPNKQVALGYLTIPAGDANLNNSTYLAAYIPDLGNQDFLANHPQLDARYAIRANVNLMGKLNTGHTAVSFGSITSGKWIIPDDGPNYVYPIGGATAVINEINSLAVSHGIPGGNSTKIFLFMGSITGYLTLNLDGTPAQGGLAISSGFLFGNRSTLVLLYGDWVEIMWLNGGYVITDTSVVKKEDITDHDVWLPLTAPEKSALAYSLVYNSGASTVGLTSLLGNAAVQIFTKTIGKSVLMDFQINSLSNAGVGANLADFQSFNIQYLPARLFPKRQVRTVGYLHFNTAGGFVKQAVQVVIYLTGEVGVSLFDTSDIEPSVGISECATSLVYEIN